MGARRCVAERLICDAKCQLDNSACSPGGPQFASRWGAVARTAFPFVVVGALWEIVARLQIFPPRLFPSLETIAAAFVRLTVSGVLPHHAADTVLRLVAGFALAAVVGVAIGIVMGRSRLAEDLALPLVSMGAPIPGIAYAPLFLLWFGLGNVSAVLLVGVRFRLSHHLQHLDRCEGSEGGVGALGARHGRR